MNADPVSAGGARAAHPAARAGHRRPLHNYGLLGRSAAECIGSFLLVFATAAAIFSSTGGVSAPLAVGLAAAAGMVAFGYVSGGHFNPAVSLGSAAAGRTSWKVLPVYVVAQLIGALLAFLILWVVFQGVPPEIAQPSDIFNALANGYGPDYQLGLPLASALLAEVVGSALLVAVFLGASKGRIPAVSAAFAVGVTYAVLLTFLAPITGGSLNPARSTAAALFAGTDALEQLWLFWVAPILGALITGLIYRSIDLTVSARERTGDDAEIETEAEAEADHAADTAPAAAASAPAAPAGTSAPAAPRVVSPEKKDDARGFFDDGDDDGDRPGSPKA